MSSLDLIPKSVPGRLDWRHVVLAAVALGSLVVTWNLDPIAQDTGYHAFADTRAFFGIPNCLDVLSNLPFLIIGVLGVYFCLHDDPGGARLAWIVMFVGTVLISLGSAYYHWAPDNGSLVWDRYAMTRG